MLVFRSLVDAISYSALSHEERRNLAPALYWFSQIPLLLVTLGDKVVVY